MSTRPTIQFRRSDRRPSYGDVKIHNGKRFVRVFERVRDHMGRGIGLNYTGGRYHYAWELQQ